MENTKIKSFFSASMANIHQIPAELKKDFLEDFCIKFLKQSNCKDFNKIPLSFWCLEVFALKKELQKNNKSAITHECKQIKSKL